MKISNTDWINHVAHLEAISDAKEVESIVNMASNLGVIWKLDSGRAIRHPFIRRMA